MKKNIYSNVIILLITGSIIKVLGLLNRIIITRLIGEEGVLIYSLIMPTIMLILSISSFGFPLTISTILNNKKKSYSNSNLMKYSIRISLVISLILIILLSILILPLSDILNNDDIVLPLICAIPLIPLVSFTSILKGYYNGQRRFKITSLSNLTEQIIRILFSILTVNFFIQYSIELAVSMAILSLSIGELFSLLILILKLRVRNFSLTINSDKKVINKDILDISLPITSSRVVGSLSFFFEPIIYTVILIYIGISQNDINDHFSSLMGYALPLLSISSFISTTICTATIPEISHFHSKGDYKSIHNLLNKSLIFLFSIAIFFTSLFFIFSEEIMMLLFETKKGSNYVKIISIPYILIYFQPVFTTTLQGINKAKEAFKTTFIISFFKVILLIILSFLIGIDSLLYSVLFGILFITLFHYLSLSNSINYTIPSKIIFITILYAFSSLYLSNYLAVNSSIFYSITSITITSLVPLLTIFHRNNRTI